MTYGASATRVLMLPREVAAAIITSAIATIGWGVGLATIAISVPVVVETMVVRGRGAELPLPLAMLAVVAVGVLLVIRFPHPWLVVAFFVGGGIASVVYELAVLHGDPGIMDDALFAINRPTLTLVAVGIPATSAVVGIAWRLVGYLAANLVPVVVSAFGGVPWRPGFGPTMVLVVAVVGFLTLAAVQRARLRRVPDFDELEAEAHRLAAGEQLARRATAVIHDTVLNDLSIVMSAPDVLDDRTRKRLLEDLETLRGTEWISAAAAVPGVGDQNAGLHNRISRMVSDFRWRGLTIHVTGAGDGLSRLAAPVADALLASVSACFENVLRHSGSTLAQLEFVHGGDTMTVMVTDDGVGFDQDSVAADRLGLRLSVVGRMAAVGGEVRIWSARGAGTSVLIMAPLVDVRPADPEPTHGRRA